MASCHNHDDPAIPTFPASGQTMAITNVTDKSFNTVAPVTRPDQVPVTQIAPTKFTYQARWTARRSERRRNCHARPNNVPSGDTAGGGMPTAQLVL